MKATTHVLRLLGALLLAPLLEAQPVIYRCEGPAGVVYSDRACAAGADPHEIDDSRVTVYTPEPVADRASPSPSAKPPKPRRSKASKVLDPNERRSDCARLDRGLRAVRAKMRAGYGVEEGERLKARQRQLVEQRRAQKCA
ncbi:hypothetical protein JM946_06865 [Steroidobacter sp. S1-65]|uniref:DUF4124 domain-containing protein n=1 Tax=Steroidobacter gossypii TaxID=2805490 RepID=A0ABS1WU14_9GAMM|nr:hypothetical protein [Steroidobacter gossypii]MBM0104460.1 hypothetical protein [Steroidobacter gossypii]